LLPVARANRQEAKILLLMSPSQVTYYCKSGMQSFFHFDDNLITTPKQIYFSSGGGAFGKKPIFKWIFQPVLTNSSTTPKDYLTQDLTMLQQAKTQRLLSLDFMRGLIMVLLVLESTELYSHFFRLTEGNGIQLFFRQFFHHPWNGLRFWDLIQPGFMFMAGTAMAYSLHRQQVSGMAWRESFVKVLKRSCWLFFWGVLDYAVRPGGLSFELWDVLTQLSATTLIAFFIFRWSYSAQIFFSLGLLLLTEVLYRFTNIQGFDQPFTDQHNFGNFIDLVLMNKINRGGWVAINFLPTAAHTIWGCLAGKLLLSARPESEKVKWLVIGGMVALASGYLLDLVTITPIIKKIATSSFVLASGGWCLLALSLFYWWIDIRGHGRYLKFFVVVGMNSLFIYLFIEIVASRWFNEYIAAITNGLMSMVNTPEGLMHVLTSLIIFALEWNLCYFLYKRGVFFKV
jgi:predicted acyltransferase